MTETRIAVTLALLFIAFMAWAYYTSQQSANRSYRGVMSVGPVNEYGRAPRRITDIMFGDGEALRQEVDERHRGNVQPILTERRRQQ
jgi:hypothetical protein